MCAHSAIAPLVDEKTIETVSLVQGWPSGVLRPPQRSTTGLPSSVSPTLAPTSPRVSVEQFDPRHRCRVAVAKARFEDTGVAAFAAGIARRERREQLLDRLGVVAQLRQRLAAHMQVFDLLRVFEGGARLVIDGGSKCGLVGSLFGCAALAERHQLLDIRARLF